MPEYQGTAHQIATDPALISYLDTMAAAYTQCALWSSTDPEGRPLDRQAKGNTLHPDARAALREACHNFLYYAAPLIESAEYLGGGDRWEQAGQDFWLTRNRHGAGFWDGAWSEPQAGELTKLAHTEGSSDLYVGDDGLIHVTP